MGWQISLLFFLLVVTSKTILTGSAVDDVCPYNFTVLQHLGDNNYNHFPLHIIEQSATTVEFMVGNTWMSGANESIDEIYVVYSGDDTGSKACYKNDNVVSMQSIDSSLVTYCTPTGISMIRLFVRDASFDTTRNTATIPECCGQESGTNTQQLPGMEYTVMLTDRGTCGPF